MAEFEGFGPGNSPKDCTDREAWGTKSTVYSYIFKGNSKVNRINQTRKSIK